MKYVAFVIVFLLFGAFFIVSNENLALKNSDSRLIFARHYYGWFVGILDNFKSISGDVIHSKWLPDLQNRTTNKVANKTVKVR